MDRNAALSEDRPALDTAASARALAAVLPHMTAEMHRINRLSDAGNRQAAIEQFYDLTARAIATQRGDVTCKGYVIRGSTTEIGICRMPALPRPGKPIALFLPGLLAALPLTAARALAFIDLFDIVLCELPGHGASGEAPAVSVAAFAAEYAAVIDATLKQASNLFVIGESLGGLVGLALAHLRPGIIHNLILIDTPFHLTRPDLAAWISEAWRGSGRRTYVRRICMEIMGFDPANGRVECTSLLHDMVRHAPFGCAHIIGSNQQSSGIASVVTDDDIAALRRANPALVATARISGTGHAVLLDHPAAARAALQTLLVRKAAP